MAIAPDSSETFVREVDENLRRDQMREAARKYAGWAIGAMLLFLAAVAGYLYWQGRRDAAAQKDSEALTQIITDLGGGNVRTVPQRLEPLANSGIDGTRATALLTKAALAIQQNDRKGAAAQYAAMAADKGLPQPYRDLATIRGAALEFDSLDPQATIARLEPLAKPGSPWFGSAAEMTALAMLKQGREAEAGRLFAAIAADRTAPRTLRSRAVQIAGSLGVDASSALPAEQ